MSIKINIKEKAPTTCTSKHKHVSSIKNIIFVIQFDDFTPIPKRMKTYSLASAVGVAPPIE